MLGAYSIPECVTHLIGGMAEFAGTRVLVREQTGGIWAVVPLRQADKKTNGSRSVRLAHAQNKADKRQTKGDVERHPLLFAASGCKLRYLVTMGKKRCNVQPA